MSEDNREEYSVWVFFADGSYAADCQFVDGLTAVQTFKRTCETVGARIGAVQRVIITDGGDHTNAEWKHGEGYTYPPELVKYNKQGASNGRN